MKVQWSTIIHTKVIATKKGRTCLTSILDKLKIKQQWIATQTRRIERIQFLEWLLEESEISLTLMHHLKKRSHITREDTQGALLVKAKEITKPSKIETPRPKPKCILLPWQQWGMTQGDQAIKNHIWTIYLQLAKNRTHSSQHFSTILKPSNKRRSRSRNNIILRGGL